jgi:acetyltransferase-like isoleucine patch superfamily enzyme/SAM-dependent methyltransferase
METTCPPCKLGAVPEVCPAGTTAIRCSILLPSSPEPSRIADYLRRWRRQNPRPDYEVMIEDRGAAPRGKYLLFVRELVDFDAAALDQAVSELETSGRELSISQTGKFVLVERSLYQKVGGLEALLARAHCAGNAGQPAPRQSVHCVHDLNDERADFARGPDTSIAPDVVIDSPEHVRIGANCVIRKGVVLRPAGGEIIIGDHCVIDCYCVFHGTGGIYIGDWATIGPHCCFDAEHPSHNRFDVPIAKQAGRAGGIYLMGDNRIGAGSVVGDDVTIGKGAVIAPNSAVLQSLPMACVAEGAPARLISKRHCGAWDSRKEERAVSEGMPEEVHRHVMKRAALLQQWIEPHDCLLDLGCGEGLVTAVLAARAGKVVGCDYSTEAVQVAGKRHPTIEFVCCNSTNLPFPSDSFTKVALSDVAEHLLPVQLTRTLAEVQRVLAAGGTLLLATPLTGKGRRAANYAHIYEYCEAEIRTILGEFFGEVKLVDGEFGLLVARKGQASSNGIETNVRKGVCHSYGRESTS